MPQKKYIVRLTAQEREICRETIRKLNGSSEKVRRAHSRPGDGADDDPGARPGARTSCRGRARRAVPPRGQRADQARRAIQGLGLRVCPHTLGHRTAWGDASALGLTVGEYQPAGCAAAELRRVVEWVTLLVAQPQLPEASDVEVRP